MSWLERTLNTQAVPYREFTLAGLELRRGARPHRPDSRLESQIDGIGRPASRAVTARLSQPLSR